MGVRTCAVVLFDTAEGGWLIDRAAEMAVGFDAHLIGLHPFSPVVWADGLGADAVVYAAMVEREAKETAALRAAFDEALRRNGLQGEFRAQGDLTGAEPFLVSGGRGADVVILGTTAERTADARILAQRVVRESGRPAVILGRESRFRAPAKRIVAGWTDTREAARAVHDAVTLAAPGAKITLVSFFAHARARAEGLSGRDDLAAALDREGFVVDVADQLSSSDALPDALVRFAQAQEADLLVTGAFGHSHIYDLLIGAVTRELMDHAPLPTLLSR